MNDGPLLVYSSLVVWGEHPRNLSRNIPGVMSTTYFDRVTSPMFVILHVRTTKYTIVFVPVSLAYKYRRQAVVLLTRSSKQTFCWLWVSCLNNFFLWLFLVLALSYKPPCVLWQLVLIATRKKRNINKSVFCNKIVFYRKWEKCKFNMRRNEFWCQIIVSLKWGLMLGIPIPSWW